MPILEDIFVISWVAGFGYSQTRVFVWFSTLVFPFYKMLFMNRLEFSLFHGFFVRVFKTREEYGFL
jgi:hypothetical protein